MTETIETNHRKELSKEEEPEPEIIYAGEEAVKVLLAKMRKIKLERDVIVGSLELQLQELKDELHQKSMPFDQMAEAVEIEIKDIMPAIAETIKTENGAALYRKGSLRVSYDSKALDAITEPYVQGLILPFRKETTVKPSISIEVY